LPVPLVLVVPGSLDTPTGGYVYDRRIVAGLRRLDWRVDVLSLDDSFPYPTSAALADAASALSLIPDGTTVLIDGLAGGAMPAQVEQEASRLRIVALVHHPLAHETGISKDAAAALEASEKRTLASARRVVVTSRTTAACVAAVFGVAADRIAVVEPGVDPAPLAAGSKSKAPELLCVATISPRKGYDTLARALTMISDREWHLTCVGSLSRHPQAVDRLRAGLRAGGIEHRVSLAGEADADTISTYYQRADLFVLPTEYEGYGMVVAEALAHGLPVVSTPAGAIPDLVGSDAGVIVPAGDANALARALVKVLDDPALLGRLAHGAARVRERLPGWNVSSGRMAEVLARVASE
jgi:glycosyltransferase involved in cell wall biosynthesis